MIKFTELMGHLGTHVLYCTLLGQQPLLLYAIQNDCHKLTVLVFLMAMSDLTTPWANPGVFIRFGQTLFQKKKIIFHFLFFLFYGLVYRLIL